MDAFDPHEQRKIAIDLLDEMDRAAPNGTVTSGLFKVFALCLANERDSRRVFEHFAGTVGP